MSKQNFIVRQQLKNNNKLLSISTIPRKNSKFADYT